MFKIIHNGRRFNNKVFASYEQARSYIRKWLRKNATMQKVKVVRSNPPINYFGFKIASI